VLWTIIGLFACYLAFAITGAADAGAWRSRVFALTIAMLGAGADPGNRQGKPTAPVGGSWSAGFSMQPSELTKIAFAIWGAHLLARAAHGTSLAARDADSVGAGSGDRAWPSSSRSPTWGQTVVAGHHPAGPVSGTPGCRCGCS